ncbi:hypothetical protein U8527_21695 [Kordia algicida OT-1]|uniref:Uncharacterized protein n=1 Tax=Kordia algicida OT-1 TaxID=391587 RepID=A9DQ69_9FLAO|nr:hypothetical protein [Kordia algicida]EDP96588.1 hypothetical protein KAOT1_15533 [Kordia algicida OT-1]
MKKQNSKLHLAKKVISTLKTNAIKGGTNTLPTYKTDPAVESTDNC